MSICVATGSLQLALQRQLPAELLVPLSHAKDSASHLMDIVNDLISLSAIESGTLQLGTRRRAAPRRAASQASDHPPGLVASPDLRLLSMPSRRAPHTEPLTAPPDLPVLTRLLAPLLPRNTIQSKTERRRFNLHELCDAVREQVLLPLPSCGFAPVGASL